MTTYFSMIPTSLYIHIPWCVKKCPYCDFNSHTLKATHDEQTARYQHYFDALIRDLQIKLAQHQQPRIHSIFFGGGTPSLTPRPTILAFMRTIKQIADICKDAEITLEANPGTVDQDNFNAYRQAGINRLSIGAQSFSATQLKTLGRIHNPTQVIKATKTALRAGFEGINIDMMVGLPQQSCEQALDDIQQAIALQPTHLSAYQLTLEPNTLFYQQAPAGLPDNDQASEIQAAVSETLALHNYQRYEVSAYCQPGFTCQHNLNYWQFGDYIAIGAGAHGKLTSFDESGELVVRRYMNHRHPQRYLQSLSDGSPVQQDKTICDTGQIRFEFLMNALRLGEGFSLVDYQVRTGEAAHAFLEWLEKEALLDYFLVEDQQVRLTDHAYQHLDSVLEKCLP